MGTMPNLHWLSLDGNALSGPVPGELGGLTNLQTLDLSFNALSGPVPPALGSLTNLQRLVLESNRLSGAIPSELGGLANLRALYLSSNDLSGRIPPRLGDLSSLRVLWLSYNQLSGSIPVELGKLAGLRELNLYGNQLSSGIPLPVATLGAQTDFCSWAGNLGSLCLPNTPDYRALGQDPLCGLALSNVCAFAPAESETGPEAWSFDVSGPYPNPFSSSTTLRFDLPEPAEVTVAVFDLTGRVVGTERPQVLASGTELTVRVDASGLASGTYVYRLIARGRNQTYSGLGRMMVVR